LVFTRTKHRADRVAQFLERNGVACERVHGNRSQAQRTQAMNAFKSGRYRVLVATDVAARGIDIASLSHVVNFDVPNVPDDYIHRVGRTGRAGATGEAFTFVAPEEQGELRAIERAVSRSLPRKTVEGFDYGAKSERHIPENPRAAAVRRAEDELRGQNSRYSKPSGPRGASGAGGGARTPESGRWGFEGRRRPSGASTRTASPGRARRGPR